MKNVQHDALLEQAIDIRAARTLCRDGWSCEQINAVLKNAEINHQQFETIQAQSKELDKLQQVFGPPFDSLHAGHTEPSQSDLDFLNHGPDAAAAVLKGKGWNNHEISLVIKDSMFMPLDESEVTARSANHDNNGHISTAFPTKGRNGYALGYPQPRYVAAARNGSPMPSRRHARGSLGRDIFILTFMATVGLILVFTLLR